MCKHLPWSFEHLRMRKWMDPTYGRRRSLPSLESFPEYLRLVRRFADLHGLRLPSSIPALNADNVPAKDFQFHGLTDHQTLFLSFLEAMVIRFTKLFKPCVVPILSGADAILSHPSWSTRKIGQWCQFLDRSSLMAIDRCQGLLDHRDQLLSAIASVTLGSCPKVAANMLPPAQMQWCFCERFAKQTVGSLTWGHYVCISSLTHTLDARRRENPKARFSFGVDMLSCWCLQCLSL